MAIKLLGLLILGQVTIGNTLRLPRADESAFPTRTDGGTIFKGVIVFGTDAGLPYVNNGSRYVATGYPQEFGSSTFVAGSKAVTFGNAFEVAPVCVCSDTGGAALACSTGTSTTSGVTFYGTVTNTFNWFCISTR